MTRVLTVEETSCDHCEQSVEGALYEVSDVSSATADREREQTRTSPGCSLDTL